MIEIGCQKCGKATPESQVRSNGACFACSEPLGVDGVRAANRDLLELIGTAVLRGAEVQGVRHHDADQGDRFVLGAWDTSRDVLCGVAVVGNPRAPALARLPWLLEVTRLCTDGTKNACSFLYANSTRVAEARGFTAVITYTLAHEGGASLRALGWWPEDLAPNPKTTWANREGRRGSVRADRRWLWLSRFEFHATQRVNQAQDLNLSLFGEEASASGR